MRRNGWRFVDTCYKRVHATQFVVAIRFNQSRIQRATVALQIPPLLSVLRPRFNRAAARSSTYTCHYESRNEKEFRFHGDMLQLIARTRKRTSQPTERFRKQSRGDNGLKIRSTPRTARAHDAKSSVVDDVATECTNGSREIRMEPIVRTGIHDIANRNELNGSQIRLPTERT